MMQRVSIDQINQLRELLERVSAPTLGVIANGQRVTSTNSGSTWTADTTVGSSLIGRVVSPAIVEAERAFSTALAQISMDELARRAETLDRVDGVRQPINFTI